MLQILSNQKAQEGKEQDWLKKINTPIQFIKSRQTEFELVFIETDITELPYTTITLFNKNNKSNFLLE